MDRTRTEVKSDDSILNHSDIELSVLAPAHNEDENIDLLIEEVGAALEPLQIRFEFIIVDDGSTDQTREKILAHQTDRPWVRCVSMTNTPSGSGHGQSAAFHAGFRSARGRLVATLDADLQNDPADLPKMLELLESSNADFVQGDRSQVRSQGDAKIRQFGSWVGRKFRLMVLGDTITDTGCSLRIMKREIALKLPLEFKGAHRFIPATARHLGYAVVEIPVNHRNRHAGEPKYGMGITKRALPGLIDLFAIRWMRSRRRPVTSIELTHESLSPTAQDPTPQDPTSRRESETLNA
ncbi:MAG: glycosyltransferase family 2 protein [Phycisphaerales bacterium]|nr:glycosyltransferase family 2 protein [Phycisphaerales bacterium]